MKITKAQLTVALISALFTKNGVAEEWNADIGFGASALRIQNNALGTEQGLRPNLYFRIYRPVSDSWQLGTSVEWLVEDAANWGGSDNVLMWRLADLDYRLSSDVAFSFHGGIARYFREQPSYGYGYGFGMKYRLSGDWLISAGLTVADVDLSTDVPTEKSRSTKDDLKWASVLFSYMF